MATRPDAHLTPETRGALVKQRAVALGFQAAGITDLSPTPHGNALQNWLDRGMAGEMSYMARQAARRLKPASILPGATRALVVTSHYDHRASEAPVRGMGRVAKYARGIDYHDALRGRLEVLERYIMSLGDERTVAKAYVDAGPVPERELAQRAGLGWIGKNTMLISPRRGSYSFLAAVLTNLDIAPDQPFTDDHCGTCRRCIDACPTGAITADRVVDARLCISYLTIEQRGLPDPGLAAQIGDWVFGCDVCQDVCPWNARFADRVADVAPMDPELAQLDLVEFAAISDEDFNRRFGATPFSRPGAEGMRRNAALVLRNQQQDS